MNSEFNCDYHKIVTSSGKGINFLTKLVDMQKIRNCVTDRSQEPLSAVIGQREAVFRNKVAVKCTCLGLVKIERSVL